MSRERLNSIVMSEAPSRERDVMVSYAFDPAMRSSMIS
jgi:hypothetical protein